ncbi:laminin subunit beta-1-like [Ostrinia furnacalis]|uniref:laminin subunit beta-1-like n=1 Tax=Ostrinia furnacalis TaxID=93504 RepID=UPI00103BBDF5|nr:laminin subunit beta-1-like [Ostrinia furnacalis]
MADKCDPKTGACLNCTGGTGGPTCAVCAEGYFGSPETGCQACPCPDRANNFASACAMSGGRLQCLCKPGKLCLVLYAVPGICALRLLRVPRDRLPGLPLS